MAASVTDTLTRTHRLSAPDAVDADLTRLWTEAARTTPVARARMANLVVFCEHRRGERVDFEAPLTAVPLDEVVRRHPSRVVILHHTPSGTDPGAPIAAAVSVVVFGAAGARYGVEEIAVRSACAEASLPSIVRNLTRGDVPTSIWWTEDLSRTPPVVALVAMGRQLVYDSRAWRDVKQGIKTLAPFAEGSRAIHLADLNWRRLSAIRLALVHAARSAGAGRFAIDDVRIAHRPGEGALAWLLAGWLASRLPGPATGRVPIQVDEHRRGDEILDAAIGHGPGSITATMSRQRVVCAISGGAPPFHLPVRQESDAESVVAVLTALTADGCLRDAVATLARHFAA
jgi:glucose-6-phosphate dehydrogenase assembly protein OpcA